VTTDPASRGRFPWWLGLLGGVFLLSVAWMVVVSLRDPTPPTYRALAGGDTAVTDSGGTFRVTLDARDPDRWVSVDLDSGRVRDGRPPGWDLAARRFRVISNGGDGLPGDAAVARASRPGPSVREGAPEGRWAVTERDEDGELAHPVLEDWYDYDFFSHLLTPRPRTYAVRTTGGRVATIRFLSYYCPGPDAGCVTLRYALPARGSGRSGATGSGGRARGGAP
jgi:hypothetical protein